MSEGSRGRAAGGRPRQQQPSLPSAAWACGAPDGKARCRPAEEKRARGSKRQALSTLASGQRQTALQQPRRPLPLPTAGRHACPLGAADSPATRAAARRRWTSLRAWPEGSRARGCWAPAAVEGAARGRETRRRLRNRVGEQRAATRHQQQQGEAGVHSRRSSKWARLGLLAQPPAQLLQRLVALARVAGRAAGHQVVPAVAAALGLRGERERERPGRVGCLSPARCARSPCRHTARAGGLVTLAGKPAEDQPAHPSPRACGTTWSIVSSPLLPQYWQA